MDPFVMLVRGLVALAVMVLLVLAARARFRKEGERDAPGDIGLD